MRKSIVLSAAAIVAVAGQALAQPVVDGTLVGDESLYGAILWTQNQPTSFGDNHPDNVPGSGDPENVISGAEIAIPLSAIGGSGNVRIAGWINSGDRTFMSNQVIGGLSNEGNLGGTSGIDFGLFSGEQWITLSPTAGTPQVDGQLDRSYGAPQDTWLQGNFTGFGNAEHGTCDLGGGSEIDAIYAMSDGVNLYVFVAGNVEANWNGLDLFLDSVNGSGQNTLSASNPNINGDKLNVMAGLTFDPSFTANYYITLDGGDDGGGNVILNAHFADLDMSDGFFLGEGAYCDLGGNLANGDGGAPAASATIDNSNTVGVNGSPSVEIPSRDFAVGSELDGLYGYVDSGNNRLNILLTGNMETTWNKLELFFDVAAGGQNVLRGDNVDISFNGLNRMGEGGNGFAEPPALGLTFDAGFEADYWINFNNGSTPVQNWIDAATLRTDGPIEDFNGNHLDYGAYDGGEKTTNDPINTDGPRLDIQDGFASNVYCNYGPRLAGQTLQNDPFNPIGTPELILVAIDNSNIGGVTGDAVGNPAEVTTGIEISINLDELGWDLGSEIRIAGFIANDSHSFVSNQVLGGLPGPDQLGEVANLDLSLISGDQFVVIPTGPDCGADCDGNGTINTLDFLCFLNLFSVGDPEADCDGNGTINTLDFLCFLNLYNDGC